MSQQGNQVWTMLLQAGVVQGSAPATNKPESPWYVKVLLAFSGWFAALFLLGFIGVGFEFVVRSGFASFITGTLMVAGAFAILRMPRNEFFEHLALAVSLAGQALVVWAIIDTTRPYGEMTWTLIALLEVMLAVVMPNFVHRVLSSFIAVYAFSAVLIILGAPYVVSGVILFLAAWLWLNEFRYPQQMKKIQAIGYGLVLALIPLKGSALFGYGAITWRYNSNQPELWVQPWMGEVLASAVTLYVIWQILQRYGQPLTGRLASMALVCTLLLCAVSMEVIGITVGMTIMLLGFVGGNRVLLGLGITSLLFYISSYYYFLDATLLSKAQTLFIVSLVLFVVRWLMLRVLSITQETSHA